MTISTLTIQTIMNSTCTTLTLPFANSTPTSNLIPPQNYQSPPTINWMLLENLHGLLSQMHWNATLSNSCLHHPLLPLSRPILNHHPSILAPSNTLHPAVLLPLVPTVLTVLWTSPTQMLLPPLAAILPLHPLIHLLTSSNPFAMTGSIIIHLWCLCLHNDIRHNKTCKHSVTRSLMNLRWI